MKIVSIILLIILAGCNGEVGSLSPISKVTGGLYISPISSRSSIPDTAFNVPFQISGGENPLTCTGSVSVSSNNAILFPLGNYSISGRAPNCVLTVMPGTGQTGSGIFTVTVRDGMKYKSVSFPVSISLEAPPSVLDFMVSPDPQEDTESLITLNYTDANGDMATSCNILSISNASVSTPCSCALGICSVGITGDPDDSGPGQFIFTVTDNDGTSNTATADFFISSVNDPAVISVPPMHTMLAGGGNPSTIFLNLSDIDGPVACTDVNASSANPLIIVDSDISVTGVAPNCSVTFNRNVFNAAGPAEIYFNITDDGGATTTESMTLLFTGWGQTNYIKPDVSAYNTRFGYSVSIDGNLMAIGAEREGSGNEGSVYIYERVGDAWNFHYKIQAPVTTTDDNFGRTVSLSRNFVAIGAPNEDSSAITEVSTVAGSNDGIAQSGATYIYKKSGSIWELSAFIKSAYPSSSENFGSAVSLHGDRLVVGVPMDDNSITDIHTGPFTGSFSLSESGAAYVYKFNGSAWEREAYIKPQTPGSQDQFGYSVSISGSLIAIGAILEDSSTTVIEYPEATSADNLASNSGAVYIFKHDGTEWKQEAYLKAPNVEAGDNFGYAVAADYNKVAVSAPKDDNDSTTIINGSSIIESGSTLEKGSVYVFKRKAPTEWELEAYVQGFVSGGQTGYGNALSLKGDTLVVGSYLDDNGVSNIINSNSDPGAFGINDSGSVHVYRHDGSGWSHESFLNPRRRGSDSKNDHFGFSVSISGDSIAVGSPQEDSDASGITPGSIIAGSFVGPNHDSGAAYTYRNYSRLFEVTEYWATSGGNSITVNFHPSGGSATGYVYRYNSGSIAPSACEVTDTPITGTSFQLPSLSPDTAYNFRICATDGSEVTPGRPFTVRTKSGGAESSASTDAL